MMKSSQLKVGRELINNSQEAWLGYYVFAVLTIAILGGGYYLIRRSGLTGAEYGLALIGVFIMTLVSAGISIMCHLLGHIIDMIEEQKR